MGFFRIETKGSHIVLHSAEPRFQVSIPAHRPMRLGTFSGILNLVAERKGVAVADILAKL